MAGLGTADDIEQRYGYYMWTFSLFLFATMNCVLIKLGNPRSITEDPWRFRNLFISWFHAAISGTWDVLCFALYPELLDDLILKMNYFTYLIIPFSTGYFVYDSLDMLLNKKLFSNWEVTLHHIAVTSMFWYNFHAKMCIGYNVVALMAEINSFFLHSRKLMQMMKVRYDSPFYRTIVYLNLGSFAFCRGYSDFLILYGMTVEYSRVPVAYFSFLCFSMLVMTVINIILFWRLLKSDILRGSKKIKSSQDSLVSSASKVKVNGNHNLDNDIARKDE